MEQKTALQILKKVRLEMRPNAKAGEYDLPVILKAMHDFAELRQASEMAKKDEEGFGKPSKGN